VGVLSSAFLVATILQIPGSVWASAAKLDHYNIFSKVTAGCLIVEVPGQVKLPFFSYVLTSLNLPMLKLSPLP
jgi:hypothetical protein